MALPALMRIAQAPGLDRKELQSLEDQLNSRIDAAEAAGYQVMSLFELGESSTHEKPSAPVADDEPPAVEEETEEPVKKTT
jgi:hypothetical protein